MIVFGWNSFKLNACRPSQLGLPDVLDQDFNLERRQKYFHLFWIPFFGIGKIWALRKRSDDQLYEPNEAILKYLNGLAIQEKTPWYTFSLPLLLLAGGIFFFISSSISAYTSQKEHERYIASRNVRFESAINQYREGTYFELRDDNYKNLFLKAIRNDGQHIVCLVSEGAENAYGDNKVLEAFTVTPDVPSFDTIRILKGDLVKTINVNDSYNFKGHALIPGRAPLEMVNFTRVEFPVFKQVSAQYDQGKFIAIVQNIGAAGVLKSYTPDNNDFIWTNAATIQAIAPGDLMEIEGTYQSSEPSGRGTLSIASARDSVASFDLSIYGTAVSLEPKSHE